MEQFKHFGVTMNVRKRYDMINKAIKNKIIDGTKLLPDSKKILSSNSSAEKLKAHREEKASKVKRD